MGIVDSFANAFGNSNGVATGVNTSSGFSLADNSPDSNTLDNYKRVNGLVGTLDSLVKAAETAQGATGRMAPLGLDAIIQDWVRQQFIYRRSILQDLYVLAYQVTEIRSVVLAVLR